MLVLNCNFPRQTTTGDTQQLVGRAYVDYTLVFQRVCVSTWRVMLLTRHAAGLDLGRLCWAGVQQLHHGWQELTGIHGTVE